jgi:hypothetical protein
MVAHNLEWVTPGHPLFEALRRHVLAQAQEAFGKGACFYSLQHDLPARLDFYRARVVDGNGKVIHERLFAVELAENGEPALRESALLGNLALAPMPQDPPPIAQTAEATEWLNGHALLPFLAYFRHLNEGKTKHKLSARLTSGLRTVWRASEPRPWAEGVRKSADQPGVRRAGLSARGDTCG